MLSLAKNDRGIRLLSGAIVFLPMVALICFMSRSSALDVAFGLGWCIFAALAFIAFMYERSEEEENEEQR